MNAARRKSARKRARRPPASRTSGEVVSVADTLDPGVVRRERLWREHLAERARLMAEHPLEYLFLEVTRSCNLACAYCGSSCGPKTQRTELSIDEWLGVVRQIATDFDARSIMVAVTGGEPLLKPDIFRLFTELKALGYPYGMVTNGCLLDADLAGRLVEAGMGSISLSLDAPPELNDRLRGAGTSASVRRAVEALRGAGYAGKLEIISTVTSPAVAHLDEMRQVVSSMGVPCWRVAPVMPIGRAARRPELVPGPREIRQILEFILRARTDGTRPRPEMSEEGYVGNRFEGNVRPYLCQCRAGITIGGILSDGRIGACPELGDAFVQGRVQKDRFSRVWRERYQVFRDRSWTRRGQCAGCEHFPRCEGGALHLYETLQAEPLRCLYLLAKEGGG